MCCPGMTCSNGEGRAHLGPREGSGSHARLTAAPLPPQVSARPWSRPTERPSRRRRALRHCPDGRPRPPGYPRPKVRRACCCDPAVPPEAAHPSLLSPGHQSRLPPCPAVPWDPWDAHPASLSPAGSVRDALPAPPSPTGSGRDAPLSLLSPVGSVRDAHRAPLTPEDNPGMPSLPVRWFGMRSICGIDPRGMPTVPHYPL